MDAGQEVATLEVRASNETAQRLYEKYAASRGSACGSVTTPTTTKTQ